MRWEVDITGDPADLRRLSEAMRGGDTLICDRDSAFVFRSAQFDSFEDANDVRAHAQEIVTSLSGYSRLVLGTHKPIKVGSVVMVRDDGTKNAFVQLEPVIIRARMLASLSVTRADGTVEHHGPADSVKDWLKAAGQDPAVAKALRLSNADSLSWVELYRIYEVVEGDVARSHIVASGWVKDSEIRRFKHTANSVGACGDQARHGKENTQPPKNTMSLSQAKSLIDRLLKAWIASKADSVRNDQHAS
jgi:hypothetical protein